MQTKKQPGKGNGTGDDQGANKRWDGQNNRKRGWRAHYCLYVFVIKTNSDATFKFLEIICFKLIRTPIGNLFVLKVK